MLKLSGSERYDPGSSALAAMRSLAMLSDRMNRRIVSAVPSLIHRVATAAEIGDAMTQSARIALLNDHAAGGSGATTYARRRPAPMHLARPAMCQQMSGAMAA